MGYAERESAGVDVDAPSVTQTGSLADAHAVAVGSPVAVCGAAIDHTLDETWPPAQGQTCPRCADAVKGYQL